ncbi:hypothetical protein ACHAXA_008569 [Cyclostephanos tholiformis]|uniref:Mitochondrial carrier protein n=1 Tax=Cyclostephanos tholiformis TaxID=382380 RepID=A0ABD3RDL7_9STRA
MSSSVASSPSSSASCPPPGPPPGAAAVVLDDLEWEEWDASTSPLSFGHHCLAGSFAGVMEHTLLYPLDTVKTCWQSQVLGRAGVNNGGGGGVGVGGCGIFGVVTNERSHIGATSSSMSSSSRSSMSSATTNGNDGIWSTMKHLMSQGGGHHHRRDGHHHHRPSPIQRDDERRVWRGNGQHRRTMIGISRVAAIEDVGAPNVVDLTSTSTPRPGSYSSESSPFASASASASTSTSSHIQQHQQQQQQQQQQRRHAQRNRPWSEACRATRNATMRDITAHGTIRSSSGGIGIGGVAGGAAILDATSAAGGGNVVVVVDGGVGTGTTTNASGGVYRVGGGIRRLFRGVQTMFLGCVPAHALYFSSYEFIKGMCTAADDDDGHHGQYRDGRGDGGDGRRGGGGGGKGREDDHGNVDGGGGGHVGRDTLSTTQAMLAGTVATLLHDFVMTPMDTMKQRLQLGHYDNLRHSFVSIVWGDGKAGVTGEGWRGLYRSFPVTVMTNVPYGVVMMTTNEWLRGTLEDGLYGRRGEEHDDAGGGGGFHFATILLSGMGAGTVASALTAPLDRVKTRLQTQRMGMALPSSYYRYNNNNVGGGVNVGNGGGGGGGGAHATMAILEERALAAAQGKPMVCPKIAVADARRVLFPNSTSAPPVNDVLPRPSYASSSIASSSSSTTTSTPFKTYYTTPFEAFNSILAEEGPRGLFRGTLPRVALHAPSVAISWTAYEMAKDWLLWSHRQ